jgi:hypothetical protein
MGLKFLNAQPHAELGCAHDHFSHKQRTRPGVPHPMPTYLLWGWGDLHCLSCCSPTVFKVLSRARALCRAPPRLTAPFSEPWKRSVAETPSTCCPLPLPPTTGLGSPRCHHSAPMDAAVDAVLSATADCMDTDRASSSLAALAAVLGTHVDGSPSDAAAAVIRAVGAVSGVQAAFRYCFGPVQLAVARALLRCVGVGVAASASGAAPGEDLLPCLTAAVVAVGEGMPGGGDAGGSCASADGVHGASLAASVAAAWCDALGQLTLAAPATRLPCGLACGPRVCAVLAVYCDNPAVVTAAAGALAGETHLGDRFGAAPPLPHPPPTPTPTPQSHRGMSILWMCVCAICMGGAV